MDIMTHFLQLAPLSFRDFSYSIHDYLPEVKNIINSLPSTSLQGYSLLEVVLGISRAKLSLFDKG